MRDNRSDSIQQLGLVVGLGNPGPRYASTRHNAGTLCVQRMWQAMHLTPEAKSDFFAHCARDNRRIFYATPTVFMNESGRTVAALARFYRIDVPAICIVHDDLDLPVGAVRLKRGGGHGGHNGLRDIIRCLGSADFCRIRLGIGHPGTRHAVHDYVLSSPNDEENCLLDWAYDAVIAQHAHWTGDQWAEATRILHTQTPVAMPSANGT